MSVDNSKGGLEETLNIYRKGMILSKRSKVGLAIVLMMYIYLVLKGGFMWRYLVLGLASLFYLTFGLLIENKVQKISDLNRLVEIQNTNIKIHRIFGILVVVGIVLSLFNV